MADPLSADGWGEWPALADDIRTFLISGVLKSMRSALNLKWRPLAIVSESNNPHRLES